MRLVLPEGDGLNAITCDRLLARLLYLAPSQNARMHQDQLISSDGRHLLVTATPAESATNTVFARRLSERTIPT